MSTVNLAVALWTNHMSERGGFPACMTRNEFSDWSEAEREAPTKPIRQFSCRDCTREYQVGQIKLGNCALERIHVGRIAK